MTSHHALIQQLLQSVARRTARRRQRQADLREALRLAFVTPLAFAAIVLLVVGAAELVDVVALYRQALAGFELLLALGRP